jgi:hypothetical protein
MCQINGLTKTIRTGSIFLLLTNGLNAIMGGWLFMSAPRGDTLGMTTVFLENSPFHDFSVPCIILFVANGLFSLMTTVFAIWRWKYYPRLIFFQGVILTGWIIIQAIMIQNANLLHIYFGGIGGLLVVFGIVLEESLIRKQINRESF